MIRERKSFADASEMGDWLVATPGIVNVELLSDSVCIVDRDPMNPTDKLEVRETRKMRPDGRTCVIIETVLRNNQSSKSEVYRNEAEEEITKEQFDTDPERIPADGISRTSGRKV